MTKLPAFWIIHWRATIRSGIKANMHSTVSELIADARRNLIVAQLLLEADETKIQDGYRIYKGLGLILRVAVFEPCKPVVREGVVETSSDRPTHARVIAAD